MDALRGAPTRVKLTVILTAFDDFYLLLRGGFALAADDELLGDHDLLLLGGFALTAGHE